MKPHAATSQQVTNRWGGSTSIINYCMMSFDLYCSSCCMYCTALLGHGVAFLEPREAL